MALQGGSVPHVSRPPPGARGLTQTCPPHSSNRIQNKTIKTICFFKNEAQQWYYSNFHAFYKQNKSYGPIQSSGTGNYTSILSQGNLRVTWKPACVQYSKG